MFGLTLDEASGEAVEIWPDNFLSVNVFVAMSTQWRVGMAGATGLDYAALPVVMSLAGVRKSERDQVFRDLRMMEDVALTTMRASK